MGVEKDEDDEEIGELLRSDAMEEMREADDDGACCNRIDFVI